MSGLSAQARAVVRARTSNPFASLREVVVVSGTVDLATAARITVVSCAAAVAPDYHPDAIKHLSGKCVLLQADPHVQPPQTEFIEVNGVVLSQPRSHTAITMDIIRYLAASRNASLSEQMQRNCVIACETIKFSNNHALLGRPSHW